MRSRNIKPDYFRDYQLCQLDIYARVLFSGLWCLADRDGRLEDCPPRIRADVFPYDDVEIEKLLESLATSGFITRYTVEGDPRRYIQIRNFHKHQNPHKNEKPSEIPAVDDTPVITRVAPVITGADRADSLLLIPDSLTTDPCMTPDHGESGGDFFDMSKLNALAVQYLGWNPNMNQGRAEQLRPLTAIFKDDVMRGFEVAAANGKASIFYVSTVAQGHGEKNQTTAQEDEKQRKLNDLYAHDIELRKQRGEIA